MPIDPSIALAVKSPTFNIADPIEQFGQILSLRNLMQTGQMGQLDLQTKQLALEQERRRIQEQQNIINELNRGGVAPPPAPPPALPITSPPGAPLGSLFNGGRTVNYGWDAQPASPPALSAAPPAAAPPAPAAAAPTQAPPSMGNEPGLIGNLSASDILRLAPTTGMPWIKQALDMRKDQLDLTIKHHDDQQKRWAAMAGAAQAIQASQNPEAEFKNQLVDLYNGQTITAQELDAFRNHGYDPVVLKGWMDRAISQADFHANQKTDAETRDKNLNLAVEDSANVHDQPTFTAFLTRHPEVAPVLGTTYSPDAMSAFQFSTTAKKDRPKAQMDEAVAAAQILEPARAQGDDAFNSALAPLPKYVRDVYATAKTPLEVRQRALTAEQATTAAQAAATLAATNQREQDRIAIERIRTGQENQRIQIEKQKADAEYGPGTIQSIAAQIYANPDSVDKFLTPQNAGAVTQAFNSMHPGLPLPTPLKGAALDQEAAAKNTKASIDWIRTAMKNPNIANNVGGLLGRLQNAEQTLGETTGLTGADAQMAQEFRSRMRFLLANEGGTMRARINPTMMDDLAKSGGNIKMTAPMLLGALNGVEGYANDKIDTYERQRFGGQMRQPPVPAIGEMKTYNGQQYMFTGGNPKDQKNWALFHPTAK